MTLAASIEDIDAMVAAGIFEIVPEPVVGSEP
jgi:hypothetical protein